MFSKQFSAWSAIKPLISQKIAKFTRNNPRIYYNVPKSHFLTHIWSKPSRIPTKSHFFNPIWSILQGKWTKSHPHCHSRYRQLAAIGLPQTLRGLTRMLSYELLSKMLQTEMQWKLVFDCRGAAHFIKICIFVLVNTTHLNYVL